MKAWRGIRGAVFVSVVVALGALSTPAVATHGELCNPVLIWVTHHGTDSGETFWGNSQHNCVDMKGGPDNAYGDDDNDAILGGNGADRLEGQDSGDGVNGQNGADTILGNEGVDIVYGGDGDDDVFGGTESDSVFGDDFSDASDHYGFSYPDPQCDDYPECSQAVGGGSDVLGGEAGDDWLWESNSDSYSDGVYDYLDGGAGYDYCAYGPEDESVRCEWGPMGTLEQI